MEIDDRIKAQILLAALERRYASVEAIRDRTYGISISTLGVFLVLAGWIVQGNVDLGLPGKIFLSALVILALCVVLFYIRDLERGFRGQLRTVVRIEKLLKLYEPGFFGSTDEELYPRVWLEAGTETGQGRFFGSTYLLLCIGATALTAAVALSGVAF